MKTSMCNLLAACMAVAVAGLTLPASAYYLSHWEFSSDAMSEYDYTGHNDLVNTNGVPVVDGALAFDGTVKEVITRHLVDINPQKAHTFECFVQADVDCDGMIMELSSNNNDNIGGFYLYAKEGAMARTGNRGHNGEKFKNGTICDGQWHHVAVIIDPTTNVATDSVRLYVDRERQGVRSFNESGVAIRPHILYIGSRGGKEFPFKGKIDDVRITDYAMSTNEFLKARSSETIDVRAFWKFDSESPLADSSGNGNVLQGSQGVTFANGYASFNGTASDVRTVNKLDLSAYTNVTVECFVRKHAGGDVLGMMLEHSPNYYMNVQGFYLTLNESRTGAIQGNFLFGNGYRLGMSPTYAVNAGWHHVALVKDASLAGKAACVSLYVDGIRMSEYNNGSTASGDFMRNDYFYIGSRANSSLFLDADIDDIRITAGVLPSGKFLRTRTGALDDRIAYWPFAKAANMLEDASGNGNALTGTDVTVNDGAAVFDGSQSGFSTLAPLPLYAYRSMTVEWFMKSSMSDIGIVLETTENYSNSPGAFYACANEFAGYRMINAHSVLKEWSKMDGKWHHYALVYDWDKTDALDIVRLYCDGDQVTMRYSNSPGAAKLRAGKLYIGSRAGTEYKFVGELDDIKITGRALDPSEFMTKRSSPPGVTIIIR